MKPIGPDMRSLSVRAQQDQRAMDALPWETTPGLHWRALGWALVVVMICAGLLGLMAVGK